MSLDPFPSVFQSMLPTLSKHLSQILIAFEPKWDRYRAVAISTSHPLIEGKAVLKKILPKGN